MSASFHRGGWEVRWRDASGRRRARRFPSEDAALAFDEALAEVSPAGRRADTARRGRSGRVYSYRTAAGIRWRFISRRSDGTQTTKRGFASERAARITFSPPNTGSYQVSTPPISQIENSSLNPVFGDLLQPAATAASKITVQGAVQGLSVKALPGGVLMSGSVLPGSGHANASVALLARSGKNGAFRKIASSSLGSLDHSFAVSASLKAGAWSVELRFQDPGQVLSTTTRAKRISVPPRDAASVTASSFKIKHGTFTINGKLGPKPLSSGTTVQVLGLDVGALPGTKGKKTADAAAAGAVSFRVIAKAKVRAGATKFTVRGRLKRGQHWFLQLKYAPGGAAGSAYGGLRSVRVT